MKDVYERKIGYTEASRHFIYVSAVAGDLFPRAGKPFVIRVGRRESEVKRARYSRLT